MSLGPAAVFDPSGSIAGGRRVGHRAGTWVLAAFVGSLAIYAWGAAPTVLYRDSAELQAVALTGGVAHSTGYPTFALVGWVFGKVLPGDPARRINLMSSAFGAVSLALLVVVGVELGFAPVVAFAGAIVFGAGFSFWAGALRAEVYTLAVAQFLVAYWRTLVALRTNRAWDAGLAAVLLGFTLTGHLASAPAVAVLGLSLAWRSLRRRRVLREWPVLLLGFTLGLTPYLHIPWTDTHRDSVNFLHHMDHVLFPETGVPTGAFASPWYRLEWLVTGRNEVPGAHLAVTAWNVLRTVVWWTPLVVLFELGPIAALLAVPGFLAFRRDNPLEAHRVAVLVAASLAFTVSVTFGPLLPLFLVFAMGPVSLLVARGLERLLARGGTAARPWLVPLAAAAVMLVPHAIRLWSYAHPIGPHRWTVLDEDMSRPLPLLRRFDRPFEARDYGRGALRAIPHGAIVFGESIELPILYYFCGALGERTDLTLRPHTELSYPRAVRAWERTHDLAEHPVVFLTLPGSTRASLTSVDSLPVAPNRWIYLTRTPLGEAHADEAHP